MSMGLEHHVNVFHPAGVPTTQQWGRGHHPATATVKRNKEVDKVVMGCFDDSKLFKEEAKPIRRYRKRKFRE